MAVDYFLIHRGAIDVRSLYRSDAAGRYHFDHGVNRRAIAVFVPSAAVSTAIALLPAFAPIAALAWPIGLVVAGAAYFVAMGGAAKRASPSVAPEVAA
jgi:NCS1 family nucleobase:cation symporter-1